MRANLRLHGSTKRARCTTITVQPDDMRVAPHCATHTSLAAVLPMMLLHPRPLRCWRLVVPLTVTRRALRHGQQPTAARHRPPRLPWCQPLAPPRAGCPTACCPPALLPRHLTGSCSAACLRAETTAVRVLLSRQYYLASFNLSSNLNRGGGPSKLLRDTKSGRYSVVTHVYYDTTQESNGSTSSVLKCRHSQRTVCSGLDPRSGPRRGTVTRAVLIAGRGPLRQQRVQLAAARAQRSRRDGGPPC